VNGVLRSADREIETLRGSMEKAEAFNAASIPPWLMAMWKAQYGEEKASSFAENTLSHAAPCWRVNWAREGAEALRLSWLERGYALVGQHGFTSFGLSRDRNSAAEEQQELARLEHEGFLTRQGISSQLVSESIADWIAQDKKLASAELWDACCGRGGKSTALLEKGVRVTLASDPAQFRLDDLLAAMERLGLPAPQAVCSPEQDVQASYPLILIDVPCSGTGTLGRVPELRLRLNPDRLNEAERLQASILENAWGKLQPGGLLFYATCALNRKENESRIERFLKAHDSANLCEQSLFLPELPGHDALFLAVLRKKRKD
ncbi:MAG: hypothetical protein IKY97_01095, partial [Mailhella sp.]|nr:hypothetical protein [Mailhella sp.]